MLARHASRATAYRLVIAVVLSLATTFTEAQVESKANAPKAGQQETIQRLLTLLESNPKPGAALNKVYDQVRSESVEVQRKLVALRPDDGELRYRFAQHLAQAGQRDEACRELAVVIKQNPARLQRDYYEVVQVFRAANKSGDLLAVFEAIDLRQLEQPHYVMDFVRNLLPQEEHKTAAMALFKKVWATFPESRLQIMSSFYEEGAFSSEELFEYAMQAIVPSAEVKLQQPWQGLSEVYSYGQAGTTHTVLQRIVEHGTKANRLANLRTRIALAAEKEPKWKAGPFIIAAIDARLGKPEVVRRLIEQSLAAKEEAALPSDARWVMGQILEPVASMRELVANLYEGALAAKPDSPAAQREFEYSPAPRLLQLYIALDRRSDARMLLKKAEQIRLSEGYEPSYAQERHISHLLVVAGHYQQLNFPLDALRLYREVLEGTIDLGDSRGNREYYLRQAEAQRTQVMTRLTASLDPALVQTLLAPRDEPDAAAIDLMLGIRRDEQGQTTLDSPLIMLLTTPSVTPELAAAIDQQLLVLTKKHPRDIGVRIVAAILALHRKNEPRITSALAHLRESLENTPLETIPAGRQITDRQRQAALEQVALWLVAAPAATLEKHQAEADFLAARAQQAAGRQASREYAVAILNERIALAIAAEDQENVERHLTSLLDLALARPAVKGTPAEDEALSPLTLSQFRLAMSVAHCAAEQNLPKLASKAVQQSLAGGLPMSDRANASEGVPTATPSAAVGDNPEVTRFVGAELATLSEAWRKKKYPPQFMYDTLHAVVLPSDRGGEVAIYPQYLANWSDPRSLARDLARFAVATKQVAALQNELVERREQPSTALPVAVLEVLLAVESEQNDQALEPLDRLVKQLQAQPQPTEIALASHAAALAFTRSELQAVALPIFELAVKSNTEQVSLSGQGPVPRLVRYYRDRNEIEKLGQLYETYLQARQDLYARYNNPSYAAQQHRSDLSQIVHSVAQIGDPPLLLAYLGRLIDLPNTANQSPPALAVPLWHLARGLTHLKPEERYRLLKDWTLPPADPAEERPTLRFAIGFSVGEQMPAAFLPKSLKSTDAPPVGPVSNLALLVAAAQDADQLDELALAAESAEAAQVPHSECLAALIAIAQASPSAAAHAQSLANAAIRRIKTPPPNLAGIANRAAADDLRWDDLLLLQAALVHGDTRAVGQQLAPWILQDNRQAFHLERVTHVARLIALDGIADLSDQEQAKLLEPGLRHWSPGSPPHSTATSSPPAWWTASGDHVTHLTGYEYDSLFFNYPLTGSFEFSFEAHSYDFSQAEVAYGGLMSIPEYWNAGVNIMPVSRHETVRRGGTVEARQWWNRYSVKVTPQAIRFFSNGHLVYEEPEPSGTSPWLHLVALDHRRVAMRRLTLTGQPQIPREVQLVEENRFEGWVASQFNEKLPTRLTDPEAALLNANASSDPPQVDPRPLAWRAEQGVLYGRRDTTAGQDAPSRLSYHRPLRDGDVLSYDFFYEPGQTHVHPALGRLAFLLDDAGVRLHWIGNGQPSAVEPFELPTDNAVEEPQHRRGPQQLPLKADAWNHCEIRLTGNVAQVTLNDQLVYERPLEQANDLRFGLFHYRAQTQAQVKNIVLRGDWPETLAISTLGNLLELESPQESAAVQRARQTLTREEELVEDVYHVWKTAQSLAAPERYDYLSGWVLPSAGHATFRLQAAFSPVDPPLPAAREAIKKLTGKRLHVGGELVSPAIELVRTAVELKRLDDLETDVMAGVRSAAEGPRNLLALQTLIALARQDDKAAIAGLLLLQQHLQALEPATTVMDRFPEFVAVAQSLQRPELRKTALPIAELLVTNQQGNYQTIEWERKVRWLRAATRWANDPATAKQPMRTAPSLLTQWTAVSHPTAELRGRGLPPATWQYQRGKAALFTGHGNDSLYFQSPLMGNFEVKCRRTTHGWKEIRLLYGATAIDVHHTGDSLWRIPLGRGGTQIPLPAKIDKRGAKIDYHLTIKNGVQTVSINGKQVLSDPLPAQVDPWLAIQTYAPHYDGSVENLQILGSPQIPSVVDITAAEGLSGWRSDYYGESIDHETAVWRREQDEIVGKRHELAPDSQRESVLHYHRPLLDDGVLAYEFFYEAGKTEVHPAIDRAALLIGSAGVQLHYLTDAAYDRSGIDPANAEPVVGSSAAPPLKNQAWNKVELQLAGDRVTAILNGEKIAQYSLEPTNQRLFGLFRFSDATNSRVRNVSYRGNWPKKLPPLAEQQLALP